MASIPDLLILKAYAFEKLEKPKDAYDLCFCLEHYPGGRQALAREFRRRLEAEGPVAALANQALLYLQEKFATLNHLGPNLYAEFHNNDDPDQAGIHRQRAFQLVREFLDELDVH